MCSFLRRTTGIATLMLLLGAMAWTQTGGAASPDAADRTFMNKAAQGNMAEVEMGKLAQQNAQSQEVKDFGSRMVTDHSAAMDKLKEIAKAQGVTLPAQLSAKDKAMLDKMSKLHGDTFDKAYMHDMLQDHQTDVAEFKRESKAVKDPQLKDWVTSTLPTLESHLDQAKKVASSVGANQVAAKSHTPATKDDMHDSKPQ